MLYRLGTHQQWKRASIGQHGTKYPHWGLKCIGYKSRPSQVLIIKANLDLNKILAGNGHLEETGVCQETSLSIPTNIAYVCQFSLKVHNTDEWNKETALREHGHI